MLTENALHRAYRDITLLRANLGFRLLAARRVGDGRACVLVAPNRLRDPARSRAALERAAAAHARIEHPAVPRTTRLHEVEGRPVLELECHAIADGLELLRRLSASGTLIPYTAADGFIVGLRVALQAAHRVGLCLGRISNANVLFGPDGRLHLVGFGHNFALEDENGLPEPSIPQFAAPELAMGGAASPSGDYVALLALMRAGIPMVDTTGAMRRVLGAIATRTDAALLELVLWVERRVMSAMPDARASIDESVATADRIRALLGVEPDHAGFAALAARTLRDPAMGEALVARGPSGQPSLVVGPDAEWIQWDEERRRLRGPMRRVLLVLVEKQQLGSPEPVRTVDLAEVGWPDEQAEHESALNRVYVTMNRLRKVLPEGSVERFDDGYRLRPEVAVHRVGV
ncbi:hypothetical protein [Sandaracinus amylolyticus]|uniref:hypothetical protein n=1 Tax=Sandaracinus amylolyticus TaxID=927083 RepID=UPI001F171E50|nr:hypothetical protein [Sandaracinus amylolyticus]UJR80206.1 Hypothetical protein I5071_22500 [Sandaracinus amylolyticus]